MSGYKRGLDLAVLQEREQGGLTCGYELFRRINNLLGVTTRAEALSLREAVMRLDVNGLKQLGCPSAGSVKNPLDTCLFLTQEFARLRDQCAAFADLQMMEVDQIMVMMRCLPQEIHRHLAFHGKSATLRELMESLEFYEQQSKALDFSRDSRKGNPVGYDRPPKGSPKGGKDRTPKGEGKGKEIRCRRCGKPGHVEKDCWSKSPKRTDKDKGKGKGSEKGGKPKGGKDRSHSPYDPKRKGNPKGGKPKGSKGEPKGRKGPKGGKPKGARASVGEEDEEDILGMGCALDMTVPPDVLLNQLHSYGNRLTTSSVADTDATDPHFLVDSGASIHLISQSLVDEGYLRICQEWAVNKRCATASGQEMILDRCVEAEFSTYALRSRHVSFLECDGAAASSPDAASSAAASSRAAAPPPAAPASSSLSPVSRSICAGSQLQRPQKLRVTALIGCGQVSLLSVALLASKGWTFTCSPGKSGSRTSREVDKQAKPPCLSLSHFGGHDQVPTRTRSSRTHLNIFLWCNVPWISIVHPGAIDIDMSSSLRSLQYTSDVDSSSHRVVRYSTMRDAVQDSVLHVAERDGSSSVHERIDCADPVQPRFRRVEHAFGCLGRYHGAERREEEGTESGYGPGGTDGTHAGHSDRPSRPTGCGKGSIGAEGRYRVGDGSQRNYRARGRDTESGPCHDGTREQYRSDREASGTGRKRKRDWRRRNANPKFQKDLPEPEIPEKPFEATSDQEVTFRMKAWSNWLHRQDQKEEEKRIKNRARQRALRQQRRSDRAVGLQQAVRQGPSLRRSWTVSREDPEPKGSIRRVLKQHTKAPRKERTVKLRLIEREVQASRVTAKGEYMVQNKHRAWIAPKRRPRPEASESRVKKEFVEIKPSRGVTMVSLTASEASDVGDMEEVPESAPAPSDRSRTGDQRDHHQDRRHAGRRSCRKEARYQTWDCFLYETATSRERLSEVYIPGQVTDETSRQLSSVRGKCQYFRMDVGDSPERRSASPRADRGEPEEIGRIGQAAEIAFDPTDQSQISAYRPPAATRAAARVATSGQAATYSACESGECQAGRSFRTSQGQAGGSSGAEDTTGSRAEDAADQQAQSEESTAYRRAESGSGKPKICSGKQRGVPRPSRERRNPRRRAQVRRRYRNTWSA